MLTQQELKKLVTYDPDTGIFRWAADVGTGKIKAGEIAGSYDSKGYLRIGINGRKYKSHRLAWLYVHGCFPEDEIDHINRVRDDNRIENLRAVTGAENCKNTGRKPKAAPFCGVQKRGNNYEAHITRGGARTYLGRFKSLADAVVARMSAEMVGA